MELRPVQAPTIGVPAREGMIRNWPGTAGSLPNASRTTVPKNIRTGVDLRFGIESARFSGYSERFFVLPR